MRSRPFTSAEELSFQGAAISSFRDVLELTLKPFSGSRRTSLIAEGARVRGDFPALPCVLSGEISGDEEGATLLRAEDHNEAIQLGVDARRTCTRAAQPAIHLRRADDHGEDFS